MQKIFDQLAKAILAAVLRDVTRLETNREIRGHVLEADVWVEPDPERSDDLAALGVLGRMIASGPCLIEPFSGVPRESEVRSCILKQYSLNHALRREAKAQGQPAPAFPSLWIVAVGSPDSVIKAMELRQLDGWPGGFMGRLPFDRFCIVILRRLPRTPETLFLRLLSRGGAFYQAAQELATVPKTTPASAQVAWRVMRVLVEFRTELEQTQLKDEDMEALPNIELTYEEWLRQVRSETLIDALRSMCDLFEIALTDERLSEMETWDAGKLKAVMLKICASHDWPTG